MTAAYRPDLKLAPHHLKQLRASGLTDETLCLNEVLTINRPKDVSELVGRRGDEGIAWAIERGACIGFGCKNLQTHKMKYRLRPDNPEIDEDGDPIKYVSPLKRKNEQHAVLTFWPARSVLEGRLQNLDLLRVFTEGEKKAMLVDQVTPHAVIGLTGVWGAHNPALGKSKSGKRERFHLLDTIAKSVALKGARCCVLFDADAREKLGVMHAAYVLVGMLKEAGAASVTIALPPGPKPIEEEPSAEEPETIPGEYSEVL